MTTLTSHLKRIQTPSQKKKNMTASKKTLPYASVDRLTKMHAYLIEKKLKSIATTCDRRSTDCLRMITPASPDYVPACAAYGMTLGTDTLVIIEWYKPEAYSDDDLSHLGYMLQARGGLSRTAKAAWLSEVV